MSERGAEKDALVDVLWAEFDKHHLSGGGRNLGQYRTAWECTCGFEFVSDGHRGISVRDGMNEHLARMAVATITGRITPPAVTEGVTP